MSQRTDIAIVGMAGRLPRAADLTSFWRHLVDGVDGVDAALGPPPHTLNRAWSRGGGIGIPVGYLDGFDRFDASFFQMSPLEARITDPQQRLLLEIGWEALEDAGYGEPAGLRAGVFATASQSGYVWTNVRANAAVLAATDETQLALGNAPDFLATRLSFKLDLRGPSMTVQAACASSLVAVHLARQSLLAGECDLAVVAAASVTVSPWSTRRGDGTPTPTAATATADRCRAFSTDAQHTVAGDGVVAFVLRRLADARTAGDDVRAVLLASAVTNDGGQKMSFPAPGVDGQAQAAREALATAGVTAESVDYIEGHGSGTPIGDSIELAALAEAYGQRPGRPRWLGSVKSNIGYPDGTAGLVGLAKTVLALRHGLIPGNLHFTEAHPGTADFTVVTDPTPWPRAGAPRRAAVASYGMGGTNVHLIVQEAPRPEPRPAPRRSYAILTASGRSDAAADAVVDRLTEYLPGAATALPDVAFTLHVGRRAFPHRRAAVVAADAAGPGAAPWSRGGEAADGVVFTIPAEVPDASLVALLAQEEPVFQAALDDLSTARDDDPATDNPATDNPASDGAASDGAASDGAATAVAAWHALLRLWRSWGIAPAAVVDAGQVPDASTTANRVVIDLGGCLTPRGLAAALAETWCRGVEVDWHGYHDGEPVCRVPLPTYPFDNTRHWVDPDPPVLAAAAAGSAALPAPDWDAELDRMLAEGVDPVVATVAGVWQEVLGVPSITGEDDFFALGGDSLRLQRATGRLRELFDLDIPLVEAFHARTLGQLVGLLEDLVIREPIR